MAQILQLRRGTTAQNDAFTGSIAEVTVDTDRDSLRVHDGVTVGGTEIANLSTAIPLLPDATTVGPADELVVRQSGTVKRATANEFLNGTGTVTATGSTTGRTLKDRFADVINVKDFGAVGNGIIDDTGAIQAALNYAAPNKMRVFFPTGTYRTTATVGFSSTNTERFGVYIYGEGNLNTSILVDHSNGPGLTLNRSGAVISDIGITASSSRINGVSGSNYGILMEAPDQSGKAVAAMTLQRVRVIDQPSHGIVHVGMTIMSVYEQVTVGDCKGHGIVFDDGQITNRTNRSYTGLVTLNTCWIYENTGHGLKIGDPNDAVGSQHTRFLLLNCEFADNALTAGARLTLDEVWIRGTNISFDNCAIGRSSSPAVIGNIRFVGENLRLSNHRSVYATHTLRLSSDSVFSPTFGINVDGLRVLNQAQNPVVRIDDINNVRDIHVKTYGDNGNMTTMFTGSAIRAFWDITPPVAVAIKSSNQSVDNNSTVPVDVDGLEIDLRTNEIAVFDALIRYSGDSTADIKLSFAAPTGATIRWDNANSIYANVNDTITLSNSELVENTGTTDFTAGSTRAFGCAAGTRSLHLRGRVTMSSTPGPLKMQFAQNVATPSASATIVAQSMLRVFRQNQNT